ncbi:MAG: hypothetical protein IKY23_07355 [Lachnospiraceae bacterium]|nr:hypothetical protein [Lachnospiraceae bacterium]
MRTKDLFGNNNTTVALCEYTEELSLLKEFIEIADEAVQCRASEQDATHKGICYLFARAIVDYAKMAYDNILMGHFKSAHMVMRTMVENLVCLDVIIHNEKEELWKYYYVQSYRDTMKLAQKERDPNILKTIKEMCSMYNIEEEFLKKRGDKRAYIDSRYGWTYKINSDFNFAGLSRLVSSIDGKDFKMLSDYSHGTSLYQRLPNNTSDGHIKSMFSVVYTVIDRLIVMYGWDDVDDYFDELAEMLEVRINNIY